MWQQWASKGYATDIHAHTDKSSRVRHGSTDNQRQTYRMGLLISTSNKTNLKTSRKRTKYVGIKGKANQRQFQISLRCGGVTQLSLRHRPFGLRRPPPILPFPARFLTTHTAGSTEHTCVQVRSTNPSYTKFIQKLSCRL